MRKVILIIAVLVIGGLYYFTFVNRAPDVNSGNIEILEIGSERKSCEGEAEYPQGCLIVNGKLFYENISGFDYEPGYEYILKVRRFKRDEGLQDVGKYEYSLVEIISKK